MNQDPSSNPRQELEARVTALLLGEITGAEADNLRKAIAQDAELTKLYERLKSTIELVSVISASPAEPVSTPAAPLQLSQERRQKLLAQFKTVKLKEAAKPRPTFKWLIPAGVAAVLLVMVGSGIIFSERAGTLSAGIKGGPEESAGARGWLRPSAAGEQLASARPSAPASPQEEVPRRGKGEVFYQTTPAASAPVAPPPVSATPPPRSTIVLPGASGTADFNTADFAMAAGEATVSKREVTLADGSVQSLSANALHSFGGSDDRINESKASIGARDTDQFKPGDRFVVALPSAGAGPDVPKNLSQNSALGFGLNADSLAANGPQQHTLSLSAQPTPRSDNWWKGEGNAVASAPRGETRGVNAASVYLPTDVSGGTVLANAGSLKPGIAYTSTGVGGATVVSGGAGSLELNGRNSDYSATFTNGIEENSLGVDFADKSAWGGSGQANSGARTAESASASPTILADSAVRAPEPVQATKRGSLSAGTYFYGQDAEAVATAVEEPVRRLPAGVAGESAKGREWLLATRNVSEAQPGSRPALEKQRQIKEAELKKTQAEVETLRTKLDISDPDRMGSVPTTPTPTLSVGDTKPYHEAKQRLEALQQDRAVLGTKIAQLKEIEIAATPEPDLPPAKPAVPLPEPQPELQTRNNAFSTFSLNVSDVSFKLAGASLQKGVLPEPGSIRSEEFINAFDYRDPEPAAGAPVAFAWERARYPFAHNRDLLRFSLKTAASGRSAGRPLNLVLLLDNSGSMERADRVGIIREALRVLASQLQPQDKLSVVTFARTPQLRVDGVSGSQAGKVAEEVSGFTPEGGTNLEEAMNLAYATALKHYLAGGLNRIVLLTDGAANLGNVAPEALKLKVEAHRKQGIAFDCFGIGWEGYNDDLLETLSRNGDGRYGFINTPEEAATGFAGQLAGALQVAASDVKVQVEFNPARVTAYRQIGYAKHQLTKEQFRDNTVDAAEIGAAESGNALYVVEVNPAGEGPLATVRVRYKVPDRPGVDYETNVREQEWTVPFTGNAVALEQSSPAMKLAASSSAFSEWLATSPYAGEVTPDQLLGYLRGVPEIYGADQRPKSLEWMIRQAKSLAGE